MLITVQMLDTETASVRVSREAAIESLSETLCRRQLILCTDVRSYGKGEIPKAPVQQRMSDLPVAHIKLIACNLVRKRRDERIPVE